MSAEPPSCEVAVEAAWAMVGFDLATTAAAACAAALRQTPLAACTRPTEVSVRFTDDATIATLNARWRGHDQATDVLAFPATEPGASPVPSTLPLLLGDIVVAFETAAAEASRLERALDHHVCHLLVHGFLHLAHYDHDTPEDALIMETLESKILATMGVPDPYAARLLPEERSP